MKKGYVLWGATAQSVFGSGIPANSEGFVGNP